MSVKVLHSVDEINAAMVFDQPFHGLCMESDYHRSDAMGQSNLKEYRYSPAHYAYAKSKPQEDVEAFIVGRATHMAICEGLERFHKTYIKREKFNLRSKAGKEALLMWQSENRDKLALDQKDYDLVMRLHDSIMGKPSLRRYFEGGFSEYAAFSKDEETGVWKKAKADKWHPDKGVIVDLKTTGKKATLESFGRSVQDYLYYVQDAYYTDIFADCFGEVPDFVFVAIEKSGPYGAQAIVLEDEWRVYGRKRYREWLTIHAECVAANRWPHYGGTVLSLPVPRWMN